MDDFFWSGSSTRGELWQTSYVAGPSPINLSQLKKTRDSLSVNCWELNSYPICSLRHLQTAGQFCVTCSLEFIIKPGRFPGGGRDAIIKLSLITALHSGLQPDSLVMGQALCNEELKTLSKFCSCDIQSSWRLTACLVLFQAQHSASIFGKCRSFWESLGSDFRILYHFLIPAWRKGDCCVVLFVFLFTHASLWVQIPLQRYLAWILVGL